MGHGPHRPYVSRRDFLKRSAAVGLAAAAGPWFWRPLAYAADAPIEQLHLQFGADAAREMTVSWMTPAAVRAPFVQLEGRRVAAETVQYAGYPGFFHHARVTGLEPGTGYRYHVGHDDAVTGEDATLTTAPAGRAPFTFTAFGDQGIDDPGPDNIQDFDPRTGSFIHQQPPFQATLNIGRAASFSPAFHAIIGDTSYANGDQAIWDRWFSAISPMARNTPWMPAIGNHEIETQGVGLGGYNLGEELGLPGSDSWGPLGYDAYRHRFALPANGDAWSNCWYRFRYGSVEFVVIDNNDVNTEVTANVGYSEGRQQAFVAQALARAAADPVVDFIIVLMHQAAFSSGLHGSDAGVRAAWFDLFAEHRVDLVLQAHDHHYERTHLMNRDEVVLATDGVYASDIGTMYVVCGNGGGVQRFEGLGANADWSAAVAAEQVGTLKVDVVPDTGHGTKRLILGEYRALDGSPIEEGVVIERPLAPAVVPPVETPTAPPAAPPTPDDAVPLLPVTGGPAGIGAVGIGLAAGAAARVWRRGADDEEAAELRARRVEATERARRDTR
jgi:hypothetical protein